MASQPMEPHSLGLVTPDSKKRKRRKNFTIEEENVIQTLYSENSEVLSQKFSSDVTNKAKSAIWEKITDSVNSKGVSLRTVDQVKEKWGNMAQKAKRTFTEYKIQQKKTGGGPPPLEVSDATANIINSMKDTASFSGVPGGIDTEILPVDIQILCCDASVPLNEEAAEPTASQVCSEGTSQQASCVPPSPCPTTSVCPPPSKKAKKQRHTQEDVLTMQHKVLEGQLQQQTLDRDKSKLESQRLTLQIEFLQRLLSQQEFDLNLNPTQLFMSMLN